jgi:hypothetical protein
MQKKTDAIRSLTSESPMLVHPLLLCPR